MSDRNGAHVEPPSVPESPDPSARSSGAGAPRPPEPQSALQIGRELGGDLPCVVCRYNLRGLSIRSMCPECGTLVRATILSVVDPLASELRPIRHPRLLAAGLMMWTFGAVIAVLLSWLPHTADVLREIGVRVQQPSVGLGVVLATAVSMLGALTLIRPHGGLPRSTTVLATISCLLYIPLLVLLWEFHSIASTQSSARYVPGWRPSIHATLTLVGIALCTAGILFCIRPVARALVARSAILRSGRVDRQTLWAMALAAVIMAIGAGLGPMTDRGTPLISESFRIVGIVLISFSGILLTLGVFGSLLDGARIAQAVVFPSPTLKQVIREGRPATKFSSAIRAAGATGPQSATGARADQRTSGEIGRVEEKGGAA